MEMPSMGTEKGRTTMCCYTALSLELSERKGWDVAIITLSVVTSQLHETEALRGTMPQTLDWKLFSSVQDKGNGLMQLTFSPWGIT